MVITILLMVCRHLPIIKMATSSAYATILGALRLSSYMAFVYAWCVLEKLPRGAAAQMCTFSTVFIMKEVKLMGLTV